jgi:hypothetical protein
VRSHRTLAVIAALEQQGHTNVVVRWGQRGGEHEPRGGTIGHGYFFRSDQQPEEVLVGLSLREALDRVGMLRCTR